MFPVTGLRLLLPAIVPSWRFFDMVTASPRLDFALLATPDEAAGAWQEFRPRAAVLTVGTMLRRLFWNAEWNESLFLVSVSERLMRAPTDDAAAPHQRELLLRVARHLDRDEGCDRGAWLQIRLRLVRREGPADQVTDEIVYLSSPHRIGGLVTP